MVVNHSMKFFRGDRPAGEWNCRARFIITHDSLQTLSLSRFTLMLEIVINTERKFRVVPGEDTGFD